LTGEYRNRIIIPSFDVYGNLNYWIARSFTGDRLKYKNPPKELIPKQKIIINEFWVSWDQEIVLVEGIFDAIKWRKHNVIPILGSYLSNDSLLFQRLIIEKPPRILVALDNDAIDKQRFLVNMLQKKGLTAISVEEKLKSDWGDMNHVEIATLMERYDKTMGNSMDPLLARIKEL
jgi:hypothetical protein